MRPTGIPGVMRPRSVVLALAASCVAARPRPHAPPRWVRTVTLSPDARTLMARTCFDGAPPARIDLGDTALDAGSMRALPGGEAPRAEGRLVVLPAQSACVEMRTRPPRATWPLGDATLLANSSWLWRPAPLERGLTVRTRFELPPGFEVSVPWRREGDVYVMDATALRWEGYTALGRFAREEVSVDGTVFDVARFGRARDARLALDAWLGGALRAVRSLVPEARLPRVQVLLVPARWGGDAVGFGLVSRGGGASVLFTVDPDAPAEAFLRDWQTTHEFVHLVHPVFVDDDAWLREGVATYYQEVLRARAGAQTPEAAWAALRGGLAGGAARRTGNTLADESARMGALRHYNLVYWWGAALVLMADVQTRSATAGRASMDTALRALYDVSSRAPDRAWTARDAAALFDRATGASAWRELSSRALASTEYPDFEATLRDLGVRARPDGSVALDDAAPLAAVRDAIMRGR